MANVLRDHPYDSRSVQWCSGNGLTGPISTNINQANLLSLNGLFLDQNRLTGTIPASIFGFTSLVTLRLVRMRRQSCWGTLLCDHTSVPCGRQYSNMLLSLATACCTGAKQAVRDTAFIYQRHD